MGCAGQGLRREVVDEGTLSDGSWQTVGMPTPEVIARVRELHAELAETQPDAPMAADVVSLREAVDDALREPDREHHYTSLNDQLLLTYIKFELDHPKLAGTMQAVINALSAAGI